MAKSKSEYYKKIRQDAVAEEKSMREYFRFLQAGIDAALEEKGECKDGE